MKQKLLTSLLSVAMLIGLSVSTAAAQTPVCRAMSVYQDVTLPVGHELVLHVPAPFLNASAYTGQHLMVYNVEPVDSMLNYEMRCNGQTILSQLVVSGSGAIIPGGLECNSEFDIVFSSPSDELFITGYVGLVAATRGICTVENVLLGLETTVQAPPTPVDFPTATDFDFSLKWENVAGVFKNLINVVSLPLALVVALALALGVATLTFGTAKRAGPQKKSRAKKKIRCVDNVYTTNKTSRRRRRNRNRIA